MAADDRSRAVARTTLAAVRALAYGADAPPEAGHEVVVGNYALVTMIGQGGVGPVFRARHQVINQDAAVKILEFLPANEEALHSFQRAANYLSQLNHPNIVRLLDYGSEADFAYQTLELIDGKPLSDHIPGRQTQEWTSYAIDVFGAIAGALRYAHSCQYRDLDGRARLGILHGDVKPQNLLRAATGEVKLTDFMVPDVQRYLAEQKHFSRETTDAFGTPGYMAPEVETGVLDQRCDIYSLGQTMCEILTGCLAVAYGAEVLLIPSEQFASPADMVKAVPCTVNPFLPEWVSEIIVRAVQQNADLRPQTMAEIERELLGRREHSSTITVQRGEFHVGDRVGDEINITARDIDASGSQLFIGKFHDVASLLESTGQGELAEALKLLKEAVMASEHLDDAQKAENIEAVSALGEEAAKEKPNRVILRALADGLMATLRAVPDIAQAVTVSERVLTHLL